MFLAAWSLELSSDTHNAG